MFNLLGLTIPLYGICMMIGFAGTVFWACLRARKVGITADDMILVAAVIIGGSVLGGKIMYIAISYTPSRLWDMICNGDFSFVGNGGLVFYGGLLGGLVGAILGAKIAKCPLQKFDYCIVPLIPFGHAIGRIGCHFAGCCYGCVYDGLCSVSYVHVNHPCFPVQLLEAFANILLGAYLLRIGKKLQHCHWLLQYYLISYAILRFLLEFLRGDAQRGFFGGLSTSQWISVALVAVAMITNKIFKRGRWKDAKL